LHAIKRAALSCLGQAHQACGSRDWDGALNKAQQSWELYHSPEAARFAFVVAGALGDTSAALDWRRRVEALEDPI
jgi:hypothetical protein